VVAELLRQFDPSHGSDEPIYDGEGHWADARFERHLGRIGCRVWPRLDTGKLDLGGDAFRLMYHVPGMEGLHALRDSLRLVVTAKLPIGRDGRNRPSLFPFCTTTGRNAHRKSLYNVHAGMRSFMRFAEDKVGVYLDWRTQEVGVVAALSGDPALLDAYRGGDVYHALAFDNGLTKERDIKVWKAGSPTQRQRMKALQLGLNYGMGVPALAKGLDRHPLIASGFIERHKRTYSRFWEWREQYADAAMLARSAESVFGWKVRLTTGPNRRTIYNHPAQSGGAEMLRLAAVWLCEADLVPSMLVHDGILLELDNDAQIDHVKEIMRKAGRETCNGLEIGIDVDQELRGGARYRDKRPVAQKMWETMVRTLQTIGALPEGEIE
jgi:DNA polymerase I